MATSAELKGLVGARVAIPAYCDNWMRGDTHGVVASVGRKWLTVRGDKGTKTRLAIALADDLRVISAPAAVE